MTETIVTGITVTAERDMVMAAQLRQSFFIDSNTSIG